MVFFYNVGLEGMRVNEDVKRTQKICMNFINKYRWSNESI